MNELALFAGAGGGILGGKLLGWRTVCAVEWEPYPASVLVARQNDGVLPPFPIWDDVQTFDGKPWRGIVDVVSGGFPCQDISSAGKGAGIDGPRSSMWKHMSRIIGEVKPKYAYIENSSMLRTRGLGVVLQDLAKMGYDAEWGVLSAADVGANHKRERMWIVAHSNLCYGSNESGIKCFDKEYNVSGIGSTLMDNPSSERLEGAHNDYEISKRIQQEFSKRCHEESARKQRQEWSVEPNVGRVANGVAARVDRLKALGNGQVPLCAATAFELLRARVEQQKGLK